MTALAITLYLHFQVTLKEFLALPCYVEGKPVACSTEPGSFNRAILEANACGGSYDSEETQDGPYYFAVCPCATSEVR